MVLYVTEQGARIGIKRQRLEVRKGSQCLDFAHLVKLKQVVICGMIQISTQAIRSLLRHHVELIFLDQSGSFLGRLSPPMGGNIVLRQLQHTQLAETSRVLELAQCCIAGKIHNQRALLLRYQKKIKDKQLPKQLASLRFAIQQIIRCQSLETLRGVEGSSSAAYFQGFGMLLSAPDIQFSRRIRRPPPDPTNILLSFGYTLLGNLIQGMVESASLDPALGMLHRPLYGRPSLALDLLEEWRPVIVDVAVLRALNTQAIRTQHFLPTEEAPKETQDRRALLLTPEGSQVWFASYERRLEETSWYPLQSRRLTFRQIIQEQVYHFAQCLRDDCFYTPFLWRS